MMPKELLDDDMSEAIDGLRTRQEAFALATIIRTAGATAAKPGAKAVLDAQGQIVFGWIGGGCARSAVSQGVLRAIHEDTPQLVSITPEDLLSEKGLSNGDESEGMRFARNGCPSKGTIDIFIEPCLPRPELFVFGASPVAMALTALAPQFDWSVSDNARSDGFAIPPSTKRHAIVIATQGQGDLQALRASLRASKGFVAFVGSRKKYQTLAIKLIESGLPEERVRAVQAPAGLDIGAVTPEEIALSILAGLTQLRRKDFRGEAQND